MRFSIHAIDMTKERNIREEWVMRAVESPDWKYTGADDNIHYFKGIMEYGGRFLHVVVNREAPRGKVVTVFFDRKARRVK